MSERIDDGSISPFIPFKTSDTIRLQIHRDILVVHSVLTIDSRKIYIRLLPGFHIHTCTFRKS